MDSVGVSERDLPAGQIVSRRIGGFYAKYILRGSVSRAISHPVLGTLHTVKYTSIERYPNDNGASFASRGSESEERAATPTIRYSLKGLRCSELCWREDLLIASGEGCRFVICRRIYLSRRGCSAVSPSSNDKTTLTDRIAHRRTYSCRR